MMMYLIAAIVVLCLVIALVVLLPSSDKKQKKDAQYRFELFADGGRRITFGNPSMDFSYMAAQSPERQNPSANRCWSSLSKTVLPALSMITKILT